MNRMKCVIAYDGSNFSGFQIQPNRRTVQGEMEQALSKIHKGKNVRIHASGRTDAGVHAIAQVFHFETELGMSSDAWKRALGSLVPPDIQVIETTNAPIDFHARYSALEKEYRYFVLNRKHPDIFRRNYVHQSAADYDMDRIAKACKVFEGTHDFTSFASARSTVKGSKVRTLTTVSCTKDDEIMTFVLRGNGFLQHMVRTIVGALLETGRGTRNVRDLTMILEKRDRTYAGVTVPPEGLYLWDVTYE